MTEPFITCRELAEFIADYLAGTLAAGQAAAFERHLSVCPNCVRYLASYRSTIALSRSAFESGDDMPEDLVRAILTARKS